MAGSYRHCVDDDGNLLPCDEFLLDHLGDASEAIEEMYWMIQVLAKDDHAAVEAARKEALKRLYPYLRSEGESDAR